MPHASARIIDALTSCTSRLAARRAFATALISLVPAALAMALDPSKAISQYNRQVWTTVQGLPQGSVLALAQAPDGYLWLGTRTGLARFDGVSFTLFDPATTPGLPAGTVQALRAGSDGSVWIGTDGKGIGRFRNGSFSSDPALSADSGNSLYVDEASRLWIATWAGLVVADGQQSKRIDTASGLPHNAVFSVAGDGKGRVWVATSVGLAEFRDGRLLQMPVYARIAEPQCLLVDRRGALWVGAASGLYRVHGDRVSLLSTADGLLANFVTALAEDRDGNVWIGTEGGLNRWRDGRVEAARFEPLAGSAVASLLEDREGNLWIGLRGTGLVRLQQGALVAWSQEDGLSESNVTCTFQSSDGSLWFGSTHGLTRYRDGRFSVFTNKDGLLNDSITGLGEHPVHGVLIATYARRLNTFRDGRIGVLAQPAIAATVPSVIHVDRQGALWVGTLGDGVYRVAGGKVEHHAFRDSGGRHVFHGVYEDAAGVLWFATPNGVLRYESGRFTPVEVYRRGSNFGVTYSIHGDGHSLWIGTRDRGVCLLRGSEPVRCFGRPEGLIDDTVYQVLEDDDGRLFLSTPRGLAVVARSAFEAHDGRSLPVLRLGVEDGMLTSECQGTRWPAGWKAADGRLWFPTARGAVAADPHSIGDAAAPPPVAIERVTIDGVAYDPRRPIFAAPGRREMELVYTSLSFRGSERTRFRYRLEGFDADWVEAGTRRIAHYANLRPGSYRFRLGVAREVGRWADDAASVELELQPHFQETRSWSALLAVGALVLVWLGVHWRLRRLRARAEELTSKVNEALANAKVLRGLLPICASCKSIRSDEGYWQQIEGYLREHSEAEFSHGLCPGCARQLYPEIADKVLGATGRASR